MGRKWDEEDSRHEEHLVMRDDDHGVRREERKARRMGERDMGLHLGHERDEDPGESDSPLDMEAIGDALDAGRERFFSDEEDPGFRADGHDGRHRSRGAEAGNGQRRDARDRR